MQPRNETPKPCRNCNAHVLTDLLSGEPLEVVPTTTAHGQVIYRWHVCGTKPKIARGLGIARPAGMPFNGLPRCGGGYGGAR